MRKRLDQLGIPSRLVDHGDGSSLSTRCNGGHGYGCWSATFTEHIPRPADAFARTE
ncbi:hypothetical protein OG462_37410 [Streptomyces sp. NBC_01077]|uniref:hypothetical protein n=1 Tax=Streptomyces sp. NBC_01077 TaxID=2903746 RepID=UPI00386D7D5A|nr:hypothetical protein OG462_37410 [Streptomyces sp. NBC_01077]